MLKSQTMSRVNQRVSIPFLLGGALAVLGTFGCWLALFLYPFLDDQKNLRRELAEISEMRGQRATILKQLEAFQEEASHWKELDQLRLQRCTTAVSDAEFLEWLHRQAESCDLTIRDFRPGVRLNRSGYEARGVSVSAQGTYEAVCRLIDQLRDCPQMFRVTGLDIVARDEEGVGMTLTLQGQLLKATTGVPPSTSVRG